MLDKWLNKVICGDCLEVMKEMPDGCVDLVLTDPPYNVGKNYGNYFNDKRPKDEFLSWYHSIAKLISTKMKSPSWLYVSCSTMQLWDIRPIWENVGLTFQQLLVWYGPNMIRGGHFISLPWLPLWEPILMFRKGKCQSMLNAGFYGETTHDVIIVARPQSNFKEGRYHITQKPLKLYLRLIARTEGMIIFDPFLGSGTTAIAAKELGRDFIGIEISPEYCKIAERRIAKVPLRLL